MSRSQLSLSYNGQVTGPKPIQNRVCVEKCVASIVPVNHTYPLNSNFNSNLLLQI